MKGKADRLGVIRDHGIGATSSLPALQDHGGALQGAWEHARRPVGKQREPPASFQDVSLALPQLATRIGNGEARRAILLAAPRYCSSASIQEARCIRYLGTP